MSPARPRAVRDLADPALDADPPVPADLPRRFYVICSTQRSGSGLLGRALAGTGIAGTPHEYFNPGHRAGLTERWGCGPSLDEFVAACLARRSTPNGVFGAKLHWDHLVHLTAEALGLPGLEPSYDMPATALQRHFPGATYVRILRRDIDRQAVSLWFALQTRDWSMPPGDHSDRDARARVAFDAGGIEGCRRTIERAEVYWDRFLRFNRIPHVDVVYEELCADYVREVARVLRHIVPEAAGVAVPEPASRRMADERTDEFVARYRSER